MSYKDKPKVIIIGAGMAGCFMAYLLAKRGYSVEIYEYRPDVRKQPYDSGRSFNLTLYYRGIQAMKKGGIWEEVKKLAVIAQGNAAHYSDGKTVYSPFIGNEEEVLYTVHRNNLNATLLNIVEKLPDIKLHFNIRCIGLDKEARKLSFQKEGSETVITASADLIIGADGVNSLVRKAILAEENGQESREEEDWGYKEVHISREMAKKLGLRIEATHTWPRPDSLLIAFPNPDSSFTLMFNLPLEGRKGFSVLHTEKTVTEYILKQFPDLEPLLPEIVQSFVHKPTGKFITLKTKQWYYEDALVLIGDAAHAVIPFYGQGVCAAFDDCLLLADLLDKYPEDREKAFAAYQQERKRNTDVLAELSKDNFIELRDKSRSPYFILKDKADTLLHRLFPRQWLPPLYVLIAHGNLPYADALVLHQRQQRRAKLIGLDIILASMAIPMFVIRHFRRIKPLIALSKR